jgi:hypothetical protein
MRKADPEHKESYQVYIRYTVSDYTVIRRDLQIPTVKEEIRSYNSQ